jgi:uncharacterized membrane protein
MRKRLGRTVLGLYLIAAGVFALAPQLNLVPGLMPVFAIAAGVLLLLDR